MKNTKNILLKGKHKKPILTDIFYTKNGIKKPIVIFAHGYKGYKDWGCWNLVAAAFANHGFFFVKFNFSFNGGTVENPIDFPDLEAFGNNNYSIELDDLQLVIDWLHQNKPLQTEIDTSKITLIGHSRGGGIVTLMANEDKRITSLVTWAGVSDFEERFPKGDLFDRWKKDGVYYVINGRTKQQMPHYFQFYEDFLMNKGRLHIENASKNLKIPYLIIHGTSDEAVAVQEAKKLHAWNSKSELYLIKNGNHTFDSKHPWEEKTLPPALLEVINKSIAFILA